MIAIPIVLAVFLYVLIGTVCAGVATRVNRGDDAFLPLFLLFWPLFGPLGCLMLLYRKIADR
jgi:hypothetical protein